MLREIVITFNQRTSSILFGGKSFNTDARSKNREAPEAADQAITSIVQASLQAP